MIDSTRRALCAGAALIAVLVAPAVARADVIGDWNATAQAEAVLIRPTAHGQARGMAMVQGAVYDAVNAVVRSHEPYLLDLDDVDVQPWVSQDAAVATAAHHVLVEIVAPARVAALDALYTATLAGIPDGPIEAGGVEAGEAAAEAMLTARQNDGYLATFIPTIGTDPGGWRPLGWPATPAFDPDGWVGNLKPFVMESPSQFRSEGPNALTSAAYAEEYAEVKDVGALNSTTRTADQTTAAIFWQFPPVALWNRLARDLAGPSRFGLDMAKQARLYAMINLAAADGAISCWYDKYQWNFWRPRAAIREGDTDGNPATVADPTWEPLFHPSKGPGLGTPPFPEHPSGHGCVSGATMRAFREFFGTDKVAFDVHSGRFPGQPRHFERFSQVLKEIIDARVWGGIHFRTADVQGAVIGKKIGFWLQKHYFNPLPER
ncbi:MAG TPA: vanadium-dependent haloperoxidase [Gaiella sp.]|nr:vanadium-dependent haloperoxidase [Gaiella sp.]